MSVKCYFKARFSAARRGVLTVVNLVDNHFAAQSLCLPVSVKMAAFLPWRDKQELTSRPGWRIQIDTLRHVKAVKPPKRGGSGACACARARTRGPGASFTPLRPLRYPPFGPSSTPKTPLFLDLARHSRSPQPYATILWRPASFILLLLLLLLLSLSLSLKCKGWWWWLVYSLYGTALQAHFLEVSAGPVPSICESPLTFIIDRRVS